MPELPEVETIREALNRYLKGGRIVSAAISGKKMRLPIPTDLPRVIVGRTARGLRRRGKYLLFDLRDDKGDDVIMMAHLGMSGTIPIDQIDPAVGAKTERLHDHLVMRFEGAGKTYQVALNDPRRFGGIALISPGCENEHPCLKNLGLEPFSRKFTAPWFLRYLVGRKTSIKNLLLDQRIIAGIGNIYASEILFDAGISPQRAAGEISSIEVKNIITKTRSILRRAIKAGGTTIRDYTSPDGDRGYFTFNLNVYGRSSLPCARCTEAIIEIRQGGRSSFYCPRCQK